MKTRFLLSLVLALAAVQGVAASFVGCAAETSGAHVTLKTVVVGEGRATFTTSLGWTVTLTRANLTVGPLYYFDGDPVLSALRPRSAWAHPGHYLAGEARGEMLQAATVDLLVARNLLPDGHGVTGSVRSARFTFGGEVLVAGEATRGALRVPFVAAVAPGELLDADGMPKVEGCTFSPAELDEGTVTLSIRPSVWLDQVDFTEVTGDLASSTVALAGFTRGLKKGVAYRFAWSRP